MAIDPAERAYLELPTTLAAVKSEVQRARESARYVSKVSRDTGQIPLAVADAIRNLGEAVAALSKLALLRTGVDEVDVSDHPL